MHKHASTNRFYRLVWSHVHSCWVAVAEGARGRGKSASRKLTAALVGTALSGAALAAPPGLAGIAAPTPKALPAAPAGNALPTGAQVVAGQASVTQAANQMTVHQGSDKAILNWQSFDIGANAGVRFVQPNANAVALNRVLGNDPSRIYGQLSANGKVFLVNGSGVLFGASARVDVGGLIASSLALPDGDFLAGRYTFSGSSGAGAVRNEGSIRTSNGGYVALLGPSVANAGSIVAPNGSVALGAGEQVGVDLRGDGLITLRVDRGAVAALADNSGLLQADGGRVELSAKGADALARATVNNTGVVQARGLVADGGSIRLVGDGDVHAGALDASSRNGKGGAVAVEGRFVALDGTIDASGVRGGSVDVNAAGTLSTAAATSAVGRGGDGGAVSYRSAGMIVESSSASIDASGLAKGGSIGVQGDSGVLSSSSYSARSSTGIGGRIDVSGDDVRLLGAQLDASGNTQGGLVRVGGAFQGGAVRADAPDLARFVTRWGQTAPIANATSTFVGDGTAIKVGATGRAGQGGTAVVWSDKQTTMLGSVDARGAGAAGTVEISSKDELRHVGLDRIALGAGGQLLLDPKNITIGSSGSAWTYQAVLGKGVADKGTEVGNLDESDAFGWGVALNAAGTRLAVGAPYDDGADGSGSERGAVHLFSFSNANFDGATLQGTIGSGYTGGKNLNVNLPNDSQFGSSVALNADATRLAVGSPYQGNGAVHLFRFADSQFNTPTLTQSLGLEFGSANLANASAFGTSVALNATGDRLAVGALYDWGQNGSCANCGAVYLYNGVLATPTFVKAIGSGYGVNMALPTDAQFGMSVAFDGSGDRLAVGAYGVNNSSGAVYLFNNTYGATVHAATFGNGFTGGKNLNVNVQQYEGFGSGLSFNSSGTRLAIGSMGAYNGNVRIVDFVDNQFNGAAITTVLGSGNTAGSSAEVGLEDGENFGFSVALNAAGDRLVVGSPFGDGNANNANYGYGAVRAFGLTPAPATNLAFGGTPSANATIDAGMLESALDSGTSITLQANNDITLEAGNDIVIGGGGGNGSLTLQAGRSIALNSTIITGDADLTLVANEKAANGVVNAYRDAGAASITTAAGTTINAGTGRVSMTIADGAGKTNKDSGAITIGGNLLAGNVSLKNLGTNANSNVVIGAGGSIQGTGNGLIEIATTNAGSTFLNYAGAAGIDPLAGRYLVYSNNPMDTLEGLSGYKKHYSQAYTGSTPVYASNGNWFLYSITPTLTVNAAAASKTYDGSTALPALDYGVSGFIDGDNSLALTGSLSVTGLTRNAGTYAIGVGSLGNNLGYAINYTGANFTITPRVLNATVTGVNKTYDGNNVAGVNFGDDRIVGDVLSYDGVARFSDKNAGTSKTVNVTGITLGGTHAANYTLASNSATTSADIAKRTLTASAIGLNKTYDGGTAANVVLGDDRISGDVLSLSADSASFADKNAGVGKTVTVSGIALGGDDAGNYALASTTVGTHANIDKRTLTASALGLNKTYDGGTAANVLLDDDRISGDVLSLSADSASFADKNAGVGKTVTVSGIALDGQDAANYALASTSATASANIDKRSLTATATGVNKTYDGSNAATVDFSDNRVTGDVLEYTSTASFADKNAGNGKTVSVSGIALGGQDAGNYALASTTGTTSADILKRSLNATATGLNKTYDGGTAANVLLGDDRVLGDDLSLSADSASFADKNAGTGKTITVTGIALDGQDAGNYALASTGATTSANIDKRSLTALATGVNKTYDGGTTATVNFTDDRVTGDVLEYTSTASFADKNAGNGKTVTVSGIALGGNDAGNYALASTTGTTSADIAKRTLVVGATGVNKTYDGGTSANVVLGDDRVAGDVLSLNADSASFADKNAGIGKTVTVTGIALDGQDAGNYVLASTGATASADIAKRTLVVGATGVNKTYDGGTAANVVLGDDRISGDVLSLSADGASFADKNAGVGKTVTVSGIALGGDDAGNYALASTGATTSANIDKRSLTALATGVNKTYDGSNAATVDFSDDRVTGDVLEYSASASFADKNAGNGKTVTVTGIALGGQDAGNYALASTTGTTSADIAKRTLVVGATGVNKTYDGGTAANVVLGDDRISGDVLSLSADGASFADKNAGTGKTVTVSGIALDGQDAGNYALASTSATTSANIDKRSLIATATGVNKTYDGSNSATVGFTDDRVTGDVLEYSASASFADKNAGNGKIVSVSGIALGGDDAGNYALASTTGTTSADILKRSLNATATGLNKTYDGGTAANVVLGDDRVLGDVLSLSADSASFADKNAGIGKTVTVSGIALDGQDAGNYALASTGATTSANIDKRSLSALATGVNKTYDGSNAATVNFTDDRVTGDVLEYTSTASFADKNAGNGKTVTVSGITLSGDDAGNYALASTTGTTSADIAKRTLVVGATGVNKTYDGGTSANVVLGDDRIAGDLLSVNVGSASFADKNAGAGKTVTVTGIALGGQDAGNYTLDSTTAVTQADIAKRLLTVGATGVDKVYDGSTAATVTLGDDRVAGDVLGYGGNASFADKNAGTGKTVTVTGIALSGQDAGNYALASTSATASANIDKRSLSATATGVNKTYDGSNAATVDFTDNRVTGDVLAYTSTASFADKNAGNGKTVSVSGIALGGQDAGNYVLASTTGTTQADIAKRTLVVGAAGVNKTYDGGTAAIVTFGDDRVAGDVLAYTSTASFADKNAGNGKTVSVSGIALSGQDAGNYALASTTASTSADIAKRNLVVGATGVNKTYDGGTAASVTFDDDRVAGDVLAYTGAASFADKNAGNGKAVSVTGIVVGGQDAGNYALASTSASTTADIGRRVLNAQAAGVDKVYDGGLGATVRFGDDRVAGDVLAYTSTASFADKNAGKDKAVTVSGIALGGQDAGNYTLASHTGATTASITPRVLNVGATGIDKVYDGSTVASVTLGDDRVAGDQLNLSNGGAAFADKNAGAAKAIQVSGIALGGQDAANYTLASTSLGTSAAITPRTLHVSASGVDKVYDGGTAASVVLGDDRLGKDQLSVAGNARFADKSAGSGKAVQVNGLALSGVDAGNYRLAATTLSTQAAITQATLTVKANNATRAAGLNNPVFGYSVSGLVQGDSPAILPAFVTASSATPQSAPGSYAITVGSSATLNDYKLAFVDGTLTVTGAPPELTRAIRATIAPVLPLEVTGGTATVAHQQNEQQQQQQQRELPRVEEVRQPGSPAPIAGPRVDGTIVTLSGGTEVLTRNGGVRSAQ
jgi:filamentous hemagglutinin family protein